MTMDLSTALHTLAHHRAHNLRKSQETFDAGLVVLDKNAVGKLGEEGWAFLEQLALAAIDLGRVDVADTCLKLLTNKFPASPRVAVLRGIRIEASESLEAACDYYQPLLEADPTNVAVWKRYITVLRRQGKLDVAVKELQTLLDTFYADIEGWLELADIYASTKQYAYSLQSLTHVMLLVPQNPFYIVQAAETAYNAGDIPLSARLFLQGIDLVDGEGTAQVSSTIAPEGVSVRAWYGLRVCVNRLLKDGKPATTSPTKIAAPEHLKSLATLANERLAAADAEVFQRMQDELPRSWVEEAKQWQ